MLTVEAVEGIEYANEINVDNDNEWNIQISSLDRRVEL